MEELYELAKKFRYAIDTAKSRQEFNNRSCLFNFQDNCCDMTCDLLGEYLSKHGIDTFQINAKNKCDYQWHHVWLKTLDETIVDITGDQFIGKPGFPNYITSVCVGEENEVHKIFCLDRKIEKNTIFTNPAFYDNFDGKPNFRQQRLIDAYNIIKKYLGEADL